MADSAKTLTIRQNDPKRDFEIRPAGYVAYQFWPETFYVHSTHNSGDSAPRGCSIGSYNTQYCLHECTRGAKSLDSEPVHCGLLLYLLTPGWLANTDSGLAGDVPQKPQEELVVLCPVSDSGHSCRADSNTS
ncbi:hypothetical protein BaRGS_00004455 [Batillaria attramentaria]|uniref:Uncharacterized protein n=1 Tax=Batillaria attramentaria TaxID=370345 RepID=A0ABD0LYD2_9CAEN